MTRLFINPCTKLFTSYMDIMEEPLHSLTDSDESPRISFSSEFLDESNFITICPNPQAERERDAELLERERERARARALGASRNVDFEFLSGNLTSNKMITAEELISEGKLLPFWKIHHAEKLNMITLKSDEASREIEAMNKEESRVSWFIDDDPSPRPPKCTVLWKELLRLKKQRPSTLSPSTSSSSSSSSSRISVAEDMPAPEKVERKESNREKSRIKKGQERERTRSSVSIRIRPVLTLNLPICTQAAKNAALPPLFAFRKGR